MSAETTSGGAAPELSAAKRALREALLRGQGRDAGIPRRPPGDDAPLSFAQERLWFLDRLRPGDASYNLSAALRLRGVDDEAALGRALAEIVRRHESLRTVFREVDGSAVQVVRPFRGFALPVQDLSGLAGARREAEALRLAAREAARPFDLAAGPLFRAALVRLGGGEHLLLLCSHHVVSDGWSGQVLLRELWALYDAYRQGRESPLPELPVQYADYAVWQRRQPPEAQARQLAYWKERLAGAPEVLELPTDFPRPPTPSFRGASVPVEVPGALAERLREAARAEGATLHMVVLAAFQALLGRYAGSDDVVVGSPVAGRTRRETEGLIGFFVNTLVLRVDLGGDPTFRELLARVREATLGAYGHQELPFARLVAELRPERAPGHSPLFQVMFALEDSGTAAGGGGGGAPRARAVETEPGATPFDLSLALHAHAGGIAGQLHFSTELFERGTAGRLLEHLVRVLEQAADHPDRPLSRLELPTPAERARLLGEWSGAGASPPNHGALHLRFEARAAAAPGAPALACGGEALSYGQLNARANRLARRLRARGVAAESRVGLCAGRSPDLVVGMLAILKAGGAYVPLDPAYPAERLAWMARDAGVHVLLAPAELRDRVPLPEIEAIAPGDPAADAESGDDLGIPVDPDQLAYVIYTSGSTGRPKGVAVPHGAAAGRLASAARALGVHEGSRLLSTASPSFDASVLEIFLPLVSGAALHLADRDTVLSPDALERLLRERAVDVWVSTPVLLGALPPADLPALRVVSAGGERLSGELAARWADGRRMLNLYGPTETTVFATLHEVRAGPAAPPIGRPAPGTRAYVLDAHGKPAPVGAPGELHLGGAGLARGYLGRPTLTAERFVPDPFSGEPGARMYRTGDRARWRADGELEYLGRIDQQVKVRGFRIEPGEVEAALRAHAGVEDAVVAAYEHAPGDRRLAAWVVPRQECSAALAAERVEALADGTETVSPDPGAAFAQLAQDLRRAARERLPDYMVPAVFVPIERVPLTAGGKVDRAALPAPAHRGPDPRGEEPRDYVEVQLIQLWEELLGAPGIGPTQDFFELGGNSLLALRLFSRINRRLECDLPVSTLFAGATVRQMADAIREQKGSASAPASPVVPLQPHGPLPPLFLVHSADRGVMGYVNLVRHLGADQPVYGLRDLGEDLGRPLSRIASDHVAALRSVQPRGPYHLCGWSFGGLVAYEMALQLERDGEPVAFVGLMDTMAPSYVVRFPWDDDAQLLAGLAELVALRTGHSFSMDAEALEGLGLDEQIDRLVEQLHAHGAAPPGFSAERVRYERRLMTDRHRSLSGYTEGRFSGTLTLFRASRISRQHDPFFATFTEEERWTYGWHRLSPHPVEVHPVPGSHTLIGSEPHVRVLARCMRESLAAARLRAGSGDPQ